MVKGWYESIKTWSKNNDRIRSLTTHRDWYIFKFSKEVNKSPLRLFILFVSIIPFTWLIYITPNLWNETFIKFFKEVFGLIKIKNVHDSDVQKIISVIIGSLTVIISLISAIYVFTHREQKSVAPSASTDSKKNKWVLSVFVCMIFNMVFGSLLVSKYSRLLKADGYKESLSITKRVFSDDLLILCTLLLLVYLIIGLVKHLFKTMSVDKMLKDSITDTANLFDTIVYADRNSKFDSLLEERYKKLHYSLESVFQNFKFAAENNMNKEFQDNIFLFGELVINKFKQSTDRYGIGFVYFYLIEKDEGRDGNPPFLEVYRSALRSNFALIMSLMKNQQYNKAQDMVDLYFKMYIPEEQFVRLFQNNLAIYIDTIDTNDEKQLSIFLNGISRIPKEQTLFVHKYLIMKLITKNQLINLTNAVYSLSSYLGHRILKRSTIIILLQNLIKSIEISNYAIAGFLVKFLVTNISGKDINRGLRTLKARPSLFTSIWEEQQEKQNEDTLKGINEHPVYPIKINMETFHYCLKKAYILLYGQHFYSKSKNLWFMKKRAVADEIILQDGFEDCDYSDYIISKVKTASSKYSLLFFEDKNTMKSIYETLGVIYPDYSNNTTRKEQVIVKAISFLNKIFM